MRPNHTYSKREIIELHYEFHLNNAPATKMRRATEKTGGAEYEIHDTVYSTEQDQT